MSRRLCLYFSLGFGMVTLSVCQCDYLKTVPDDFSEISGRVLSWEKNQLVYHFAGDLVLDL